MPLNTPSSVSEVIDRTVNDVFLALVEFGAKPSLKNSWLNSLIVGYCNRVFDFYFALDQAALECLPDTAVDNLDRWGSIYKVTPTPGRVASGTIIATGDLGSVIPLGTVLVTGDGFEYETQADATIAADSLPVGLITRTGSTAILSVAMNLGELLSDNVLITVTGMDQAEYNVVDSPIEITGTVQMTYQVVGTPTTPGTGSGTVSWRAAPLSVESTAFSSEANQEPLAGFSFQSPLVGVDEEAKTTFEGLTKGSDQETPDAFRTRLLERIQNPVAHFNVADIVFTAKKVSGVTRVFVFEITPGVGQVTVYFMRDNDDTGAIPDGNEVTDVKDALDLIRPANTAPEDLIVLAPTAVATDFEFSSIVPNTSSMKSAIEANLTQFFKEGTSVGENVPFDAYRSVIFNTVDTTNGARVNSFALTTPAGDIPITGGEIATLGNVTY